MVFGRWQLPQESRGKGRVFFLDFSPNDTDAMIVFRDGVAAEGGLLSSSIDLGRRN